MSAVGDAADLSWSQDLRTTITSVKFSWDGKRVLTSCADVSGVARNR